MISGFNNVEDINSLDKSNFDGTVGMKAWLKWPENGKKRNWRNTELFQKVFL